MLLLVFSWLKTSPLNKSMCCVSLAARLVITCQSSFCVKELSSSLSVAFGHFAHSLCCQVPKNGVQELDYQRCHAVNPSHCKWPSYALPLGQNGCKPSWSHIKLPEIHRRVFPWNTNKMSEKFTCAFCMSTACLLDHLAYPEVNGLDL